MQLGSVHFFYLDMIIIFCFKFFLVERKGGRSGFGRLLGSIGTSGGRVS